jgi:hypothetical protein
MKLISLLILLQYPVYFFQYSRNSIGKTEDENKEEFTSLNSISSGSDLIVELFNKH